jgi:hypothetical protein
MLCCNVPGYSNNAYMVSRSARGVVSSYIASPRLEVQAAAEGDHLSPESGCYQQNGTRVWLALG